MAELKEIQNNPNLHSIPGIAELLSFCSEKEIHRRSQLEQLSASQFEMDDKGKSFDSFAIKEYQRSAADKIMNESSEIRPPIVLYKVVEYLRDCIIDQDSLGESDESRDFMSIYSFVRDRLRCVANDFIILNNPCNEFYIKALEESSRFLIIAYHDGFTQKDFDIYQNT